MRSKSSGTPRSFRVYAPSFMFSSTVSSMKVPRPSGTWPILRRTTSSVALPSMRSPA